jgi:hypothetical protein
MKLLTALAVAVLVLSASPARTVSSLAFASGRTAQSEVGCSAKATDALVRGFVLSYSSGRVAVIERLWAPEPHFQWFSTGSPGARLGARAYDRATLAGYFRTRVRARERIRLIELRAGYDPRRRIVNFSGKLVRSADDLRSRRHDFKGAADCESGHPTLIVWSM